MEDRIDFERAFCGALLAEPGAVVVAAVRSGVTAAWFANPKWRLAWSAAVGLWRRDSRASFDANLVIAEARRLVASRPDDFGGAELTVGDCADALDDGVVHEMAAGYIAQLKGAYLLRAMRSSIEESFKVAGSSDPETACSELVNRLLNVLGGTVVAKTVPFADLVSQSVAAMREAHKIYMVEKRADYVPGLRLPWWQMTKLLNGLMPGFHIIGARTSVGKTSFALQLVRFFAESGLCVAFDSLDMGTRSFIDRFISEMSRVSIFKANFGHTGDADMASIESASAAISAWKVDVLVEYDVDHLFNWCRIKKATGALDVLFVDFVQLLSYRGADRATDTGRMTRVSKTLKRIVNELDVPIIGLSQLNRDCEKDGGREPMKADLRESGALEQDATTVMLLYHEKDALAKFRADAQAGVGTVMQLADGQRHLAARINPTFLKVDKNQNGPLGRIPFVVYSNYFTWMIGDYAAAPLRKTVGFGVTAHEEDDYTPLFGRVHADWRHSEIEKKLAARGLLLGEDLPPVNPEAEESAPPVQQSMTFAAQPATADYDTHDDDDDFEGADDDDY